MFCKKCGNKIKEGYLFCDKCGTKVEAPEAPKKKEKEEKIEKEVKEEKKVEKVEEVVKPVPQMMYPQKPKTGKGKVVLLTILNFLLLAAAITFMILWLVKPTSKCDVENYNDNTNTSANTNNNTGKNTNTNTNSGTNGKNPVNEPTNQSKVVGKWEQNVDYKRGSEVVQRTYGMIELKSDKTFKIVSYDKDDSTDSLKVEGTYTVSSDEKMVYVTYTSNGIKETETLYIENNKMCVGMKNCDNYLVKDSYNNKITIYLDTDDDTVKYIDYAEYQKLLNNKKTALVVVVREGCTHCERFESVVDEIKEYYSTPIYYYEQDDRLYVSGTPTTFIIKDGAVVDKIVGYKDYDSVETILDNNNIY